MSLVRQQITEQSIARKNLIDTIFKRIFQTAAVISASFIIIIVIVIAFKGLKPLFSSYEGVVGNINVIKFLTGTTWYGLPEINGVSTITDTAYSVGFIVVNTVYISFLAIILAAPIGVLTALLIAKIAPNYIAKILRYVIEALASVPSIIYGVLGFGVIVGWTNSFAELIGSHSKGGLGTLSVILVLAFMILPTITVISETAIRSVDKTLEQGSLALGASKTQTNFKVVLTSAKSGIFSGIILAVGRALGEATAVSMVAGNTGNGPNIGLFDITRTLTSTMMMGLKETTGLDFDIRFTVGLVLMVVILFTNTILNLVKKKVGNLDE